MRLGKRMAVENKLYRTRPYLHEYGYRLYQTGEDGWHGKYLSDVLTTQDDLDAKIATLKGRGWTFLPGCEF